MAIENPIYIHFDLRSSIVITFSIVPYLVWKCTLNLVSLYIKLLQLPYYFVCSLSFAIAGPKIILGAHRV